APPIVPMFVLVFIVLAGLNSFHVFPIALIEYSNHLSRACLITAVAAVGMKTSLQDLQKVGGGAVGLVASLTAFLAIFVMLGVLAFG
ncbi:MAG: putative sulfate exporter family transporter, partial [Marivivens sp.]|nr:putative sulfate exporter family transporter [Marivivens sp.]